MNTINEFLSLKEFESIIFGNSEVEVSDNVLERVIDSFNFLKEFSKNKVIYGVNTGFGPMAQYRIKDNDRIQLQYNLIRSHSSGTGKPLNPVYVKAAMLARLNTLSLGNSGVHPSLIHLMKDLINKNITPLIFEHGGVGASGDLVQLAHLALVLIGEGEVFYKGERRSTQEVFEIEKLKPIQVEIRVYKQEELPFSIVIKLWNILCDEEDKEQYSPEKKSEWHYHNLIAYQLHALHKLFNFDITCL